MRDRFFLSLLDLWPQALAGYGKIFTEDLYDALFRTKFGVRLKNYSPIQKNIIGTFLILLTAVIEKRFPEDSNWKKFASEIWKDAPSEIYRRMLKAANGFLENHPEIEDAIVSKKIEKGEVFLKIQFEELGKILNTWTEKMDAENKRLKEKRQRRGIWRLF